MPPETFYRAELVCLTETEEAESGTSFMSDFAREVAAAGGGGADADPVFKSDFASLVHSSYREDLVRGEMFYSLFTRSS